MKKFIIGALFSGAVFMSVTSCGCGSTEECGVNNDTVISPQLVDSISLTLGGFDGARKAQEYGPIENVKDYIAGYQLVVGNKFSEAMINGLYDGIHAVLNIDSGELALGIKINRDLYLQEFRKYIQNGTSEDLTQIYEQLSNLSNQIEEILAKREEMRYAGNELNVEDFETQTEIVEEVVE